jgi:hypothetical protein
MADTEPTTDVQMEGAEEEQEKNGELGEIESEQETETRTTFLE